jgi:serine phosphatase RsbU (regulator of sigma subunit)
MRSLSAQAAVAVENARLFNEQERSREEAEALRAVAELLVSPEDLGVALDEVARVAGDLLGAHCGGFAFSDRETLSLPPAEDVELEAARLQILDMLLLTRASEAADAEPLMIDADTLTGDARRFADERGIGRMLIVPLIEEEHTRGMLLLGCPEEEGAFTARQISLADTIGKEVSLALRNAYLFGRERARSANLERIFRISQAVSSSLQITTVLNRVLDVVQKIFTADAVALMRVDAVSRRIETSMARGIKSKELLFFAVDPGEDIPGRVFATMRPQRFDDLREESGPLAELAAEQGLRSLLVVPLVARGRSIGLLNVFAAEPSAFANEDMELLLTFGSQAALAVDTADLYGREHRVASVLQASILPQQLPHIDGLDAHSVYRPGSVEAEIGGDYYDLFKTPDGRVILAIGDVCGQGVRAATKTSMIKYLIRGLATAGLDPSAVLVELNRMASETGESSDIVTAWVGRLDLKRRVLEYASGGHPPSLVTSPDGSVAALEPTGPLLGAVPWAEYDLRLVRLEPGATLLLYTDGVTEARSRGELFGEARMRELAAQGGTAAEVTQRVLSAVNAFVGDSELKDDIAMLAVQLTDIETGA